MTTIRIAVAALVAAVTVGPAVPALAATNVESTIRDLATEAADVAAEELALVTGADANPAELRRVDARGAEILGQLDRLGVDLTEAIRVALAPLPETADGDVPPAVVYGAAIADLGRIAATPSAVAATPARSGSPEVGLLVVGALSLVALGVAALGNTLRRRPEAAEIEAIAWSDGLTGLANRRKFDHDLDVHDAANYETAVMLIDVDRFKTVNDHFGHGCGDEVLRELGQIIEANVREGDVVYRFGGEEFCVLLPGATMMDAGTIAERIVAAVRAVGLPDGSHVTVSVGVSISDEGAVIDAIATADRALYEAKHLGRDRSVSATARDLAPA